MEDILPTHEEEKKKKEKKEKKKKLRRGQKSGNLTVPTPAISPVAKISMALHGWLMFPRELFSLVTSLPSPVWTLIALIFSLMCFTLTVFLRRFLLAACPSFCRYFCFPLRNGHETLPRSFRFVRR